MAEARIPKGNGLIRAIKESKGGDKLKEYIDNTDLETLKREYLET